MRVLIWCLAFASMPPSWGVAEVAVTLWVLLNLWLRVWMIRGGWLDDRLPI